MRVLHVYSGNLYGGIEALLTTIAGHARSEPEVVHDFALCFDGRLRAELRHANATVIDLGPVRIRRPLTVARARASLSQSLVDGGYDVVVCHSTWSQVVFGPVVRRHKRRLVFWSHDASDGRHWLERWARLTQPNMAICNSHFTRHKLPALYPKVPAAVLYCPVKPACEPATDRDAMRARMQTPAGAAVVVTVTRLERWKGHSLLIEALAQLSNEPRWQCWIVGGAQRRGEALYLRELQELAARLNLADRVHFLGHSDTPGSLLVAADIYCQPNTEPEPFGISFVEALANGLPVVSTNWGGAAEIVTSECGVLVPPRRVDALADALGKLIRNRALVRRLGDAGPQRAAALCDPAQQIQQLNTLLKSDVTVAS
jgi:glycosyltransferase involved in cell wall biosynthesis